jgi:hypothetical protein
MLGGIVLFHEALDVLDGSQRTQEGWQTMAKIRCQVREGLRPTEAAVTLEAYDGRIESLPVDRDLLSQEAGTCYLPVRVVRIDHAKKAALVALPVEADSGANRLWVDLEALRNGSGEPA